MRYDDILKIEQKYSVIYADPPWRFGAYSPDANRSVENHYETMSTEDIKALPVQAITTKNAILYMWITNPHLPVGLEVITAWGFEYKTNMVWVKKNMGLGCYTRGQHELLFIATKGKNMLPDFKGQSSVIEIGYRHKLPHSEKPTSIIDMLDKLYPNLPKIELFARSQFPGWDTFGNQTKKIRQLPI